MPHIAKSCLCLVAVMLSVGACGSDDKLDEAARDRCEAEYGVGECVERGEMWVPLARATTSMTATSTTSTTAATTTTAAPPPPTRAMRYGAPCARGSHRDCIDPDGSGRYTYLKGGADCMTTFRDSPGLCSDLDEDGEAGYPDSG